LTFWHQEKFLEKFLTVITLGTMEPKILNLGREGDVLFLEKAIHCDFSGERSKPLSFRKLAIWSNEN